MLCSIKLAPLAIIGALATIPTLARAQAPIDLAYTPAQVGNVVGGGGASLSGGGDDRIIIRDSAGAGGGASFEQPGRIATFALPAGGQLAPLTLYTATVTGARSSTTNLPLAAPYVWRFTTGIAADSTRPRVTLTVPATTSPGPTAGVPANTAVTATFTEDMAPATISASSFTLTCAAPCTAPTGVVSYVVGNRTAVFTPAAALTAGTPYTGTVTTAEEPPMT